MKEMYITVFIFFIINAIFSKQMVQLNIKLFGRERFEWNMKNKKLENTIIIVGRIIFFLIGLIGLIYIIFFY